MTFPAPRGVVAVRIAGGVNRVAIHRPAGVAAQLRVEGGASVVALDGQRSKGSGEVVLRAPDVGGRGRSRLAPGLGYLALETSGAASALDRLEIEIMGGANKVVVDQA